MKNQFIIRLARPEDVGSILAIYKPYVLQTAITFDYEVPTEAEMGQKMGYILNKYPYLVCESKGQVVGYAYASDFRPKAAYQWSAESTIYISEAQRGQGIGALLYKTLFEILRLQGYVNVFAGVALPNEASVALHLNLGFEEIGVYKDIGYKLGKWHSTQWFQLVLKPHMLSPESPLPFDAVKNTPQFHEILDSVNPSRS